ncbi:MAG: glycine betaine ABC transporter substrate-binding protein [Bryobacterales bacterium]|nr:ABC transporter permease subunit [Bryobacteraceae bacterium]MDW8353877.1 glycine betaine ABC transporter substrate-binding protein [Bryobacterales bacterium]
MRIPPPVFAALACLGSVATAIARPVQVGSKSFTESVILGEIATQILRSSGVAATHRRQLGGTQVLWRALRRGEIDIYAEYTGTIAEEILAGSGVRGQEDLRRLLAASGVRMSGPLGFDNTYALGVKEELGARLGLRTISDLRRYPGLRFGFSNEFMDRADGWPSLRRHYGLPQRNVRGLDHDLAYRALASGALDVTDLYSTDAEIVYYGLRVLKDDWNHFPRYEAVLLYREDLLRRVPWAEPALKRLEGRISPEAMRDMNARVKLRREPESQVAAAFLSTNFGVGAQTPEETLAGRLARNTRDHLLLVGVSLAAAISIAVPLGVAAAKRPRLGHVVLAIAGIVQTIPSLALLVLLIPLLGIGEPPAVAALFLYSLLPIVRNTCTGLQDISPAIRESAAALGLPPLAQLWRIELPIASRAILAGIATSAVINVGTATLGALVGAGGYGQPILTGIRLDDFGLILEGALPAAALALLVQGLFEALQRLVVPKGLRLEPAA